MPRRLQQKRTKGWRTPADAIVISRPSKWGNPYKIDAGHDRAAVVERFRAWFTGNDPRATRLRGELHELRGKDLLCFCPVPGPCHPAEAEKLEKALAEERSEEMRHPPIGKSGLAWSNYGAATVAKRPR